MSLHPFIWLSPAAQTRAFFVLFAFTLIVMAGMLALIHPLKKAGFGMAKFDLAGDLSTAQRIMEAWGPKGQIYAGLNLGLDYLFLVMVTGYTRIGCIKRRQRV